MVLAYNNDDAAMNAGLDFAPEIPDTRGPINPSECREHATAACPEEGCRGHKV